MVKNSIFESVVILIHVREPAGLEPLVGEAEFLNPFFDVREIELVPTNLQDTGCVFNLAIKSSEFCPFQSRKAHVLGRCHVKRNAPDLYFHSTLKLHPAELSIFKEDEINLETANVIDNIER